MIITTCYRHLVSDLHAYIVDFPQSWSNFSYALHWCSFFFHKTQHVCILRCVATIQVKAHKHCNKSCPGLFLMPDVEICGLPFL